MNRWIDGVFHNGHIDIDGSLPLDDNTKVKVLIPASEDDNTPELGKYRLGKDLDKVNIRDFSHED
jgi:hypothetical protein